MNRITVHEAAEILGVSEQAVRIGIRNGSLPIGTCIKAKHRWNYIIPQKRFEAFVNGKDLQRKEK